MDLKTFAHKVQGATPFGGLILAFDPGETTGFTAMFDHEVKFIKQIPTPIDNVPDCFRVLEKVFFEMDDWRINMNLPELNVAIEDYRIYDWKSESHSWSQVHTIKVVGFLQVLANKFQSQLTVMRMAAAAKGFCTDQKLEMWDLYDQTKGMKHARDSLRHACYHSIWPRKAE